MITAHLSGDMVRIGDAIITGPDIIDLMLLGRNVPIFSDCQPVGHAWHGTKNLIHLEMQGSRYVIAKKYLCELLKGKDVVSIRVQPVAT